MPKDRESQVAVVTRASSGFGRPAANAIARRGHTVCAAMRETEGRNARPVADVEAYARKKDVDLHAIELDVGSQSSVERAIRRRTAPPSPSRSWTACASKC